MLFNDCVVIYAKRLIIEWSDSTLCLCLYIMYTRYMRLCGYYKLALNEVGSYLKKKINK